MSRKQPKRKPRPGVDVYGRTELHYAANEGNLEEVRRQIALGSDPNAQDDDGWCALHFAAQFNSAPITEALLQAGAKPDLKDLFGNTPLFTAVFNSRGEGAVIGLLRVAGADPHAANDSGVTPLGLARTINNFNVAQFFADLP